MRPSYTVGEELDQLVSDLFSQLLLTPNVESDAFLHRVYADGLGKYADRLSQHGLSGCSRVLDAGCGYGQWSLALAADCDRVDAVDVDANRLAFVEAMAVGLRLNAVKVTKCPVWDLPFDDRSFDGVFCYGVLFLTPWRETVAEFARVLDDGGLLYVNANGLGWYHHLWRTGYNQTEGYDPRETAATVLQNTLAHDRGEFEPSGGQLLIEPDDLRSELVACGFEIIAEGPEGTTSLPSRETRGAPFFEGSYEGALGVYEILARRR